MQLQDEIGSPQLRRPGSALVTGWRDKKCNLIDVSACVVRGKSERERSDKVTCVLVRQRRCRIRLSQPLLDVHSREFNDVCR